MKHKTKLGIWMDHASADLIDMESNKIDQSITSDFTFNVKEEALSRSESIMHNKEQQMHESYYKEISEQILQYDHVLLFGPTNAKLELSNMLSQDLHFKDIIIDIKAADKMSQNEKVAFVKDHFN